jgi:hypothetical protein
MQKYQLAAQWLLGIFFSCTYIHTYIPGFLGTYRLDTLYIYFKLKTQKYHWVFFKIT